MVTWKIFKLPDNIAVQNGRTVTLGSPSSSSVFTLWRRLSYSSNPAIWNSTKIDAHFVEEHLIVTNCTSLALRINCGLMAEKRCFKEGWQLRQLDCESRNEFFKTPCLSAKNLLHFQKWRVWFALCIFTGIWTWVSPAHGTRLLLHVLPGAVSSHHSKGPPEVHDTKMNLLFDYSNPWSES